MNIEVENLSFSYGSHPVLSEVGFRADAGETVAVLGPNGAGKSTLFRCLLGLLTPCAGRILFDGAEAGARTGRVRAGKIAYIPQSATPTFNHTVLEWVLMGFASEIGFGRSPGAGHHARAAEILDSLGIAHLARRGCARISGGERQLALLARALAQNARALVMDEPTANLDYGNRHRALARVRALANAGYTVVLSTHDPEHAFLYADKVLALQGGRVMAAGRPADVLTAELLSALYGVTLRLYTVTGADGERTLCAPGDAGG